MKAKDEAYYLNLLNMLLDAIDYSFMAPTGEYDKSLTYPVIDKVKWIKRKLYENKKAEYEQITAQEH